MITLFEFVKNSNGFTLIEVIASIALFTILTTSSLYIFQTAFFQTNQTQVKTSALNVARNTLMFMENQNFIKMRNNFEKLPESESMEIKLCDSNYAIATEVHYKKECTKPASYQPITIDGVEFNVKVYANEKAEESKAFYPFYIPIRIVVSWDLKGTHSVELKGDIKSEDLR